MLHHMSQAVYPLLNISPNLDNDQFEKKLMISIGLKFSPMTFLLALSKSHNIEKTAIYIKTLWNIKNNLLKKVTFYNTCINRKKVLWIKLWLRKTKQK